MLKTRNHPGLYFSALGPRGQGLSQALVGLAYSISDIYILDVCGTYIRNNSCLSAKAGLHLINCYKVT